VASPVGDEQIREAEEQLGRSLPRELRQRLLRDNGGDVRVTGYAEGEPWWTLHPVWDASDRKRMARTASHIVGETRDARDTIDGLPDGSIVIANNGTGDLLLVLADSDDVVSWDHETGDIEAVEVHWS
jgi:cell wall assembly regulator SMI1